MQIGMKLKQLRQRQQLTQAEVADQLQLSRKTISSWENDRSYPDIASLITLSNVYHVTVDELLKGDQNMINHMVEVDQQATRAKRIQHISYWLNAGLLVANVFVFVLRHSHDVNLWIPNLLLTGWIAVIITMFVSLMESSESIRVSTIVYAVVIFVFMMIFVDTFLFHNLSNLDGTAYRLGAVMRELMNAITVNLSVILLLLSRPSYLRFGHHN
ncbi:MAG TPA: hypothetical protein DCW31_05885 [Lactobacillus sp.]|nr:hypothetical protein [Lactobacillus sp.]